MNHLRHGSTAKSGESGRLSGFLADADTGDPLVVGGLVPFSTIDYPGRLSAVVFCQGCPWACGYCYNPHLRPRTAHAVEPWPKVMAWLDSRRGLLDAVVFSGGEPLLQHGLSEAARQARAPGFCIGLHTAGIYPARFAEVLPFMDWVGFDVKAPFDRYRQVTGAENGGAARRSLTHLLTSGTSHEVRCTVDESLLSPQDARQMAEQLTDLGVYRLVLQAARRADGTVRPISEMFIDAVKAEMKRVELRV
ncbi:MAG: anaerobic ribonucleoside-triphosphate reductase activating protein [Candidatus Accumulibacter sp.]|jgi:pyruvate formate lyase activating enzyme|nr:anaerobic ribonucleoside-triphosphate reductase activating protein [Accumulibacter sp.]